MPGGVWDNGQRKGKVYQYVGAIDNPLADLRYAGLQAFDAEMIRYVRAHDTLFAEPHQLYVDEERKVLIFERGSSIFAFNFNPVASFDDFIFNAPDGEYVMAFNSDERRFGGFSRLQEDERHFTTNHNLSLYLPCRCAVVLDKV